MRPYGTLAAEARSDLHGHTFLQLSEPDRPYTVYGKDAGELPVKPLLLHGQARTRVSTSGLIATVLVPWMLFTVIFYILSFAAHYRQPYMCGFWIFLGVLLVLVIAGMAFGSGSRRDGGIGSQMWFKVLSVTTALSWLSAILAGQVNFATNMEKYYDYKNMNEYPGVDVSRVNGQEVMDAGIVSFSDTALLDLTKATGFKSNHVYCVAPITNANATPASYDFWAVGMDCCTGNTPDFRCGEYMNARAHAGLRLLNDAEASFYRLAVSQAEVEYKIRSLHPLFFTWMQDPIAEVNAHHTRGLKWFVLGSLSFFAFQVVLVSVEVLTLGA